MDGHWEMVNGDADSPIDEEDVVADLHDQGGGNDSQHWRPWAVEKRTTRGFGFVTTCRGCGGSKSLCSLRLYALNFSLRNGDEGASARLASLLFPWLLDRLQKKFPFVDGEVIWDAVTNAFMTFVSKPETFDSNSMPLNHHLAKAAGCNVLDGLKSEKRRKKRQTAFGNEYPSDVALPQLASFLYIDESVLANEMLEKLVREIGDPIQRRFAEARLGGEYRTAALAKLSGLEHLSQPEMKKAVKRMNDRLRIKLRRRLRKMPRGPTG